MTDYLPPEQAPSREQVDTMPGPVLLEFGTSWCGHCRALEPQITSLLAQYPEIRHLKVEDGPGQPLGRSYKVKMWPNLVFLNNGAVVRQLARPALREVKEAFASLAPPAP